MMKPRQLHEDQLAFWKSTPALRPPQPAMVAGGRDTGKDGFIAEQTAEFRRGVARLYLAIVNRAILDVLENGKNSRAAQRWLLSSDFDRLEQLFG